MARPDAELYRIQVAGIVAGDRVVAHWHFRGHFTGYRIVNERITDNWHIEDNPWHSRYLRNWGCCRLIQVPGSHELCFSNPALLARALMDAGRD